MDADFKATEVWEEESFEEPHSGAQERAVDAPESQTGGFEENAALDGRDGFVDRQEEGGEEDGPEPDGDDSQGGGERDRSPDGNHQGTGHTNSREENAAIRAARLRERREAEARAAARADEEIAASGVINPYTKRPFGSVKELREYGQRLREAELSQRARDTGRTVEELTEDEENRAFLKRLRQQEAERNAAAEEAGRQRSFIERDVLDFVEKYPDVNVGQLEKNQRFRRFCGSRFGREPLAELYGAYRELVTEAGQTGASRAVSRQSRSTGGGSTGGMALSPSQQRELDTWNQANPDLAMTAKEFLSR